MGDWRSVVLQDLAAPSKNSLVGGPFGSDLTASDYVSEGIPVIRGKNLSNGRWVSGDFVRISERKAEKLAANSVKSGDIVFTQRGANHYKQVALVPTWGEAKYVISQSQMKLTVNERIADPRFIYYLFQDAPQRDYLAKNAIATGVPHTNLGILRSVPLRLPCLDTQRKIASTLGALDDKIELNHKTVETLEEMARALYRSWFVDFDPVHARAEGHAPAHMDSATAALFPDSFGGDGLPVGWGTAPLHRVCKQIKQTVQPMAAPTADFWHFSLPAFDAGKSPIAEKGLQIRSNKLFVPNDAVLFSRLNPSIPRVWWARADHALAMPAASTEFYVAKARVVQETPWLYCMLSSAEFHEQAISRVTGTSNSHQRVSASVLAVIEVMAAGASILAAFGEMSQGWFDRIHALNAENRTLATLRDTLLPRLMSGELRVGAARELIEDAA